jgi:uncharacterized protein YndB with AHSA1/START domain
MAATKSSESNPTHAERASDRELVITRTFDAPARVVFQAWTTPELLKRWWTPRSMGMSLVACEIDLRSGGTYKFTIGTTDGKTMVFHGKYVEVTVPAKLVWTNEESDNGSVTTVTFEEKADKTVVVMREVFPTKEALDESMGMEEAMAITFGQLDEVLGEAS